MSNVQIDDLSQAIERELTIYSNDITDAVKKKTKKSMGELVKKTKETAPVGKRTKHYKENIASRKLEENDRSVIYQWYVRGSDYRLSHLLNNGHQLRDGGRYEGTGFITKASESILEDYEKAIEEVIKNGE